MEDEIHLLLECPRHVATRGEMFRTLQRCGVEVEEAEGRSKVEKGDVGKEQRTLEDRGQIRGKDVERGERRRGRGRSKVW